MSGWAREDPKPQRQAQGLAYYPPYHSKYNAVERCWGILEQHWNGGLVLVHSQPLDLFDAKGRDARE